MEVLRQFEQITQLPCECENSKCTGSHAISPDEPCPQFAKVQVRLTGFGKFYLCASCAATYQSLGY